MINQIKKDDKIEDNIEQCVSYIFSQQFNSSKFFPLLKQISQNIELAQPANIIFALYNLIKRDDTEIAFNSLKKVENSHPKSAGNVAANVIKSAYFAYTKKYKQSLDSLNYALNLCQQSNLDREFCAFYSLCIVKMIQIYDFSAFRKEYITIFQSTLKKYEHHIDNCQILQKLNQQKDTIQQKAYSLKRIPHYQNFLNHHKKQSKQIYMNHQSEKNLRDKKMNYNKKSNLYLSKQKKFIKEFNSKQLINPYGLVYKENQKNDCLFM